MTCDEQGALLIKQLRHAQTSYLLGVSGDYLHEHTGVPRPDVQVWIEKWLRDGVLGGQPFKMGRKGHGDWFYRILRLPE